VASVFGRSKESTAEAVDPGVTEPIRVGAKGRPTPKRREAQRGRRRGIAAPRDRKEAYKQVRDRQRQERVRAMQALRSGDERNLPPRDRGPVRRYARDVVDARRSVAEFFLPLALIILVMSFTGIPALQILGSTWWMTLVVLIVVDSVVLSTRLKRGLRRTYPEQAHRGAVPYALMRSMQIRRFRLPPPRIKPTWKRTGRRRR
jgi:hypothetical protein